MLLKPYINAVKNGNMLGDGDIEELGSRPAVANWDGKFLAGPHLTLRAIDTATSMAKKYGTGQVVIRRSSHIGALAAYLEKPAREGLLVQIVCSDPSSQVLHPTVGPSLCLRPTQWHGVYQHPPIPL